MLYMFALAKTVLHQLVRLDFWVCSNDLEQVGPAIACFWMIQLLEF